MPRLSSRSGPLLRGVASPCLPDHSWRCRSQRLLASRTRRCPPPMPILACRSGPFHAFQSDRCRPVRAPAIRPLPCRPCLAYPSRSCLASHAARTNRGHNKPSPPRRVDARRATRSVPAVPCRGLPCQSASHRASRPMPSLTRPSSPPVASPCRPLLALPNPDSPSAPPARCQRHLTFRLLASTCVAGVTMPTIPVLASDASPPSPNHPDHAGHAARARSRLASRPMPRHSPPIRRRVAWPAVPIASWRHLAMPASPRESFACRTRAVLATPARSRRCPPRVPCVAGRAQRLRSYQSSPALPRVSEPSVRCLASERAPVVMPRAARFCGGRSS